MAANPPLRVLIIDDEPEVVEMIQGVLNMQGYESIATTQWTEVVDAAAHESPHLMLLDLNMPTIDGVSLLKFLRDQGHTFPVVVVSGYIDDEIRTSLTPFGVVEFVDKPFEIKYLAEVVKGVLSAQTSLDDVSPDPVPTAPSPSPDSPTTESSSQESVPTEPLPPENLHNPGVLTPRRRHRRHRERVMVPPPRTSAFFKRGVVQYFLIAVVCMLLAGFLIVVVNRSQEVPIELYPGR